MKRKVTCSHQSEQSDRDRETGAKNNGEQKDHSGEKNRDRGVPAPLASSVRVPPIQLLHHKSSEVGQRSEQRHSNVTLPGKSLQNTWQPKRDPVTSRRRAEITQGQQDNVTLRECLPNRVGAHFLLRQFFSLQFAIDPIALVRAQPVCCPRPVREIKNRDHAK